MRTQPRNSWFEEALRILHSNPNDRAVRIERATLEGLVSEMAAMAHRAKAIGVRKVDYGPPLEEDTANDVPPTSTPGVTPR